jgi:two-component system, LytTR family, response regulator
LNYKCIIVDDEYLAQDLIAGYLSKIPGAEVVAKCSNAMEAMAALQNGNIDIMFLDIQMPDLTGLELLKSIKNKPVVILTTAYSEYALESYDFDITDYLLKPIRFERFIQAINKATELLNLKKRKEVFIPGTAEKTEKNTKDHLFVKSDYKLIKIKFEDILYIEGLREYVSIYTKEKRIITLEAMKNLEDNLPSEKFVRIHKSYIVATDKIEAITGNCVEINKKLLPIGKTYRDKISGIINPN